MMKQYIRTEKDGRIEAVATSANVGFEEIESDMDFFGELETHDFYYKNGKVTKIKKDDSWRAIQIK